MEEILMTKKLSKFVGLSLSLLFLGVASSARADNIYVKFITTEKIEGKLAKGLEAAARCIENELDKEDKNTTYVNWQGIDDDNEEGRVLINGSHYIVLLGFYDMWATGAATKNEKAFLGFFLAATGRSNRSSGVAIGMDSGSEHIYDESFLAKLCGAAIQIVVDLQENDLKNSTTGGKNYEFSL